MKKLFLGVLAIATMVACAKEDVISQNNEAIGFKQAFVDNSVRSVVDPSLNTDGLEEKGIAAYAFVEKAALLSGKEVTFENGAWGYTDTQYWIAGAKYNFCAIAPLAAPKWSNVEASVNGNYDASFTLNFTNDGTQDLLFANAGKIEGKATGNSQVGFTFSHLLSKVKFSFENAYNASNGKIKVTNIRITNPHKTAVATVTAPGALSEGVTIGSVNVAWTLLEASTVEEDNLVFGAATDNEATTDTKENAEVAYEFNNTYESQKELLLIPSSTEYEYIVTFHVDFLVSDQPIGAGYNHTAKVKFAPAAGHSYDIKAVINAKNIDPNHAQEAIQFTVNGVKEWTPANPNPEVDIPTVEVPNNGNQGE